MNLHDIIFSYGRYRYIRHLFFWLAWIVFASLVQLTNISPGPISLPDLARYQVYRSLTRIPSILIFCYFTVYFFRPKFILTKKYTEFAIWYAVFLLLLYLFNYYGQSTIYGKIGTFTSKVKSGEITPFIRKFYSFYSNINFTGALPTCCMMLVIKYYKEWHHKKIKNEMLNSENKQAELQLLKAQIHPHFLFNTLNNIYSFTLTGSPQAEDLVNKLSGMMDYITSEGEKVLVPLEKEIQFINDYIGLENVRYGDRLVLNVSINGSCHNKMITPLLMIPFVENSFKHGASEMRGQQWIKMAITIENEQLDFKLSNSKPLLAKHSNGKKGIGLSNVQKRLELLYPGKYMLNIESAINQYSVHMQVMLHDYIETSPLTKQILKPTSETL